jgi:hypothetical protein
MNILQVSSGELRIPVERGGGIEAPLLELSLQMSKLGHSVTILDRKYFQNDPDIEYIEGVKVVRLKARRVPSLNFTISFVLNQAFFAWSVRKYLAKADFDVVHVHVSVAGLVLSLLAPSLRNRLFYTSHGNRRTKEKLTPLDRMAIFLENQLAERVRKVIIESEAIRDKLVEQAKLRNQDVVALPIEVDTDVFSPDLDVGDVGQRYGLEGKINILFVGRVHPDKGVEYLVKAANIVVSTTFYTTTVANGQSDFTGAGINVVSRNNIYHTGRYVIEIRSGTDSGNSYDHNNMFTIHPTRFVKWYDLIYTTLLIFQNVTGQELHAISSDSQFVDPNNGVFILQATSPCVDGGVVIPNFNDANSLWPFVGTAPDMGAFEYGME